MKWPAHSNLTDFQLFAIIITATFDANILYLPRVAAQQAGRDGLLAIALGGLVVMVTAVMIYSLSNRFPSRILAEYSIVILGKPLGTLVTLLYIIYTLLLSAVTLRMFVEATKSWTMFWTPLSFFMLLLLLVAVNIVRYGSNTLARISELFFFLLPLIFLMMLIPLDRFDALHLQPLGQANLATICRAVPDILAFYRGYGVLLVLFPLVANRGKILRLYIMAIGLLILMSVGATLLIFAVNGVEHTSIQAWPLLQYLGSTTFVVIERFDNAFLFLLTFQILGLVAAQYYAAVVSVSTLTKKKYYHLWTLVLWPAVYAAAISPPNQHSAFNVTLQTGYFGEIFVFSLVGLLLLVAVLRGLDERKREG